MNKFSLAFALGTGLALGGLAPAARAATMTPTAAPVTVPAIQTLTAANMSSAEFNALFTPTTGAVQSSPIGFDGAPGVGALASEVFTGGKDAATGTDATGLFAYAYQVSLNPTATDSSGEPAHIDGSSWHFNATPTGTTLAGPGTSFAYLINDGTVGGLGAATAGASAPTISWQPGKNVGSILTSFATGSSTSSPLTAGETSATFVVLSTQPPSATFQKAGVLSSDPQVGNPTVISPTNGTISPVPIPEPATVLAWAGMAGAFALARRARKARAA